MREKKSIVNSGKFVVFVLLFTLLATGLFLRWGLRSYIHETIEDEDFIEETENKYLQETTTNKLIDELGSK